MKKPFWPVFIKQSFAFFVLIVFGAGCHKYLPNKNNLQCELARCDIEFMTRTIEQNHPGSKNDQDHEFMKNLGAAHQEAITWAEKVSSAKDRMALLKKYVEHFHDGHVKILLDREAQEISPTETSFAPQNFSLREFMPGIIWVALPRFWTKNQEETEKLEGIDFS